MTRVVRFHQLGGPEVLRIEEVDVPPPGPGEVQMRVRALGINRAEALLRSGRYVETPVFPSGLGAEAAGLVEAIGAGVEGFKRGAAASLIPPPSMVRWPAYGELANFPARHLVKHPASLGFAEAAAVWMPFLTAYGALIELGGLRAGEFAVITAASSGVGLAAIQIARRVGAKPIAVTRTSAKRTALIEHGAAAVVAAEEEDVARRLDEITGGAGVRVVVDAIGGPLFEPLTAAMTRGGILVEIGGLSPEPTPFPLPAVLGKSLMLRGYLVHETIADPDRLAAAKAFVLDGLAAGALAPVIARTFPFEEIVAAHRFLESNQQLGKLVVTL